MANLNINQETIFQLFSDKKADFLIPDYQRPYAWEEDECQTLWDDIFNFAIPDNDSTRFDGNNEYFLGSIVTFKNADNKLEIIDGQQRITTLMLLLRAFYESFGEMQDQETLDTKRDIERCLWKTTERGKIIIDSLKIDSEVATDNDKSEFLEILRSGINSKNQKSRYAKNYQFFKDKIEEFLHKAPKFFVDLPIRIMNNCILLPIEAESQDTALRIFSTLNDRGLPLSDADIFKAQFYKYYSKKGEKDNFIKRWKNLEDLCTKIFHPITGTPMDELFTRYMYYERALKKIKNSTTEALRKFYEKDKYILLKNDNTLKNLEELADFWYDVSNQDNERFSERVLRRLFVLNYAPNGMWNYFVSVYFMQNKDEKGLLEEEKFYFFLKKITAFIWTYAITNPGVNALRTPVFAEMVNIIENKPVDFSEFKFEAEKIRSMFDNYAFTNLRPITKSMLTWWAFNDEQQKLLSLESVYEIEHIYARKNEEVYPLKNNKNLESLGNKVLLEKRINIRAADYKFCDKIKYYKGFVDSKGQQKDGTKIKELITLSERKSDFTEKDIEERNRNIIDGFIQFLKDNLLLKD